MADISTLGIAVDSTGVKRAADDLENLARTGGRTESALSRMVRSAREFGQGFAGGARSAFREFSAGTNSVSSASTKAAGDMSRVTRQAREQSQAFSGAASVIRRYAGIVAAAFSVRELTQAADAYTNLSARLLLATGSSEKFASAQTELSAIANRSRVGIEETSDLFAKLALATDELGVSQTELLGVTETINQAMQVSGASAQESAGALRQLGQAFASGVLRGEELNSVMEQAPRLARAIAEGMGVSIGALRQLGADGQLTAEKVFAALQKSGEVISSEFSRLPLTVGGATTQVRNALFELIGVFDSGTGASGALAEAISDVSAWLRGLAERVRELQRSGDLQEWADGVRDRMVQLHQGIMLAVDSFRALDAAVQRYGDPSRGLRGLWDPEVAAQNEAAERSFNEALDRIKQGWEDFQRDGATAAVRGMGALAGLNEDLLNPESPARSKPAATDPTDPKGAAAMRKAMMDAELAVIRRSLAEWTSVYAATETILEAERSAGLISESQYHDRKRRLIRDTAAEQIRALEAENAQIAAQRASGPERIKALSQIADNETKISDIRRKASVQVEVLGLNQEAANRAAARSFEEARLAAQNYIDTLVQQQRREVEMMGMGERARNRQAGLNQIDDRYTGQRQELENNRALLQMEGKWTEESQKQYTERLAIIQDYHIKARESYEEFWELRQEREGDAMLGVREAMSSYVDEASNLYGQMGSIVTSATQGMEDALASFVTTGKLNFKDLANSIIADMVRMQARAAMSSLFSMLLGGGGAPSPVAASASNPFGMAYHAKGAVYDSPSLSRYSNGIYNTPQFFTFARGAGVFAEAGPEAIMPLKRGRDGKLGVQAEGGGQSVTVNQSFTFNGATTRTEAYAIMQAARAQTLNDLREANVRGETTFLG